MAENTPLPSVLKTSTKLDLHLESVEGSAGGQHARSSTKLQDICCNVHVPDSKSIVNNNTNIKTRGHSGKEAKKKRPNKETPKNPTHQ